MVNKSNNWFEGQSPKTNRLKKGIGLFIFVILVLLIIFFIPWSKTWQVIVQSNGQLIAFAFILLLPVQWLAALSFRLIANTQKMQISTWQIFLINNTINFYELILPATFFGSGLRWYRYARQSKKPAESFAAFAYLKIFTVFLALLLSFGFLLFFDNKELGSALQIGQISLLVIVVGSLLFLMPSIGQFILKKLPNSFHAPTRHALLKLPQKALLKILQALADFRQLKLRTQIYLILIGIASQLIQFFSFIIIAQAVGIDLTYGQVASIRAVLVLATNLPVNFSPGIGVRDVSLVAMLLAMHISLEYAVAMSAVVFGRTLFYGLLGGVVEVIQILSGQNSHSPSVENNPNSANQQ